MRTIAFLSQKGGAGKTTLAASLAVAAAGTGERVIAFDLDPQGSLVSWGERRKAAKAANNLVIEPLEGERLPQLHAILEGLADVGFTLAVFDTTPNGTAARLIALAADICLLPSRPTCLDVDVTAATFRAACLAKRKATFLLNQCPPTHPSSRTKLAYRHSRNAERKECRLARKGRRRAIPQIDLRCDAPTIMKPTDAIIRITATYVCGSLRGKVFGYEL